MSLLDIIKSRKQQLAAKSGRERPTKLSSTKNIIRLLPNWTGNMDADFTQSFGQHFIKDAAGNIQAVYVCTAATFGKECRICSDIARLNATTTDESVLEVLKEARANSRVLVNALYINGTHANAATEPVLLDLPEGVVKNIFDIMTNYLEDHQLNILDLNEGYDLVVTKEGSGLNTKYSVTPSPRATPAPAGVMSKVRNLEEYAQQEYEAGETKARAALTAVAGAGNAALPAPAPSRPALAAPSQQAAALSSVNPVDMDALEEAPFPVADSESPAPAPAPTPAPAPKPAPTPAAPAANVADDLADLDAMLEAAGM